MSNVVVRNPGLPQPQATATGGLEQKMKMANAIAAAPSSMLPKGYEGKPGACLLAIDYAERMDLALFEVLAEVSFNRGRPTVGARLQKKLAARMGYRTRRIEGDEQSCTVAVIGADGEEVGRATYTMDIAKALGICYRTDEGNNRVLKSTWAGDPAQMLFHRATTRALDHYAPGEYSGAFTDGDQALEADVLDVLAPDQEPTDKEPPADPADSPVEFVDVQFVDVQETSDPMDTPEGREAALRAAAKGKVRIPALLKMTQGTTGTHYPSVQALSADPDHTVIMLDWLDSQ
ncbi:MAG: hypothetical protein AAGA65_23925 [Actinomycetota bacterium]